MSRLNEGQERLGAAWAGLESRWAEARREWRDAVAVRFERDFWQEWADCTPDLLKAMAELEDVLDQARRQTE